MNIVLIFQDYNKGPGANVSKKQWKKDNKAKLIEKKKNRILSQSFAETAVGGMIPKCDCFANNAPKDKSLRFLCETELTHKNEHGVNCRPAQYVNDAYNCNFTPLKSKKWNLCERDTNKGEGPNINRSKAKKKNKKAAKKHKGPKKVAHAAKKSTHREKAKKPTRKARKAPAENTVGEPGKLQNYVQHKMMQVQDEGTINGKNFVVPRLIRQDSIKKWDFLSDLATDDDFSFDLATDDDFSFDLGSDDFSDLAMSDEDLESDSIIDNGINFDVPPPLIRQDSIKDWDFLSDLDLDGDVSSYKAENAVGAGSGSEGTNFFNLCALFAIVGGLGYASGKYYNKDKQFGYEQLGDVEMN